MRTEPSSILSLLLDAGFSPNQTVLPREFVQLEGNYIIKKFVPSLAYRFSNYQSTKSNLVTPGLTWYFLTHFDWDIKYFLAVSELVGQTATTHSFLTKLNWTPRDDLRLSLGYARSHDAFESGNPTIPVSGFGAHHGIVGVRWQMLSIGGLTRRAISKKGTMGPR